MSGVEDHLREYGIHLGAPPEFFGSSKIPRKPRVFFCRLLGLLDSNKELVATIRDAVVMAGLATAVRGKAGWGFEGSSQLITETVEAYERAVNQHNFPPLDIILPIKANTAGSQLQLGEFVKGRSLQSLRYIYSKTPVFVTYTKEEDSGADLLVAHEGEWHGIDDWQNYWVNYTQFRDRRDVSLLNIAR